MMLLGNYSVLNRNPLRYLGGGTATPECNHQSNFNRGGARKNRQYVGQTSSANKLFSLPYGSYPPYMWLLPQNGGELAARRSADFTITLTGTGGLGMPGSGAATITISTNTPDGQLIVSGSGSISFSITTNNPLLTASVGGTGSASFVIDTNAPILGAQASIVGSTTISISTNTPAMLPTDTTSPLRNATASFTFTGSLVAYAVGHMTGTTDSGAITNDSIAAAVWAYVTRTLSAGEIPTEADIATAVIAAQVDGTTTLAESIRLQNSVLAGKVSGAGTGTETFRDLADTKNRVVATVDASGNRTAITRNVS